MCNRQRSCSVVQLLIRLLAPDVLQNETRERRLFVRLEEALRAARQALVIPIARNVSSWPAIDAEVVARMVCHAALACGCNLSCAVTATASAAHACDETPYSGPGVAFFPIAASFDPP